MQKSAEAIVDVSTNRRAEQRPARRAQDSQRLVPSMARDAQSAQCRKQAAGTHGQCNEGRRDTQCDTLAEVLARNADSAALGAELDVTTRRRTKAELARQSGLMDAVCERDNLMLAYQRVVENKGAAGVDGIGITELKDYLKQHWPTIKAKLLAGGPHAPAGAPGGHP